MSEFEMDRTQGQDGPPPWFRDPATPIKARIVGVELTDHEVYGEGYKFLFHVNGEPTTESVWYTTGREYGGGKNKLVRLMASLHGDFANAPDDVRDNIGHGLTLIFEHVQDGDDKWQERIVSITTRKLTKAEQGEDVAVHELAAKEAPF